MKTAGLILMTVSGLLYAGQTRGENQFDAYLQVNSQVAYQTTERAQAMTARMFREIGVTLHWLSSAPSASSRPALWLELTDVAPRGLGPSGMAFAMPYEGTNVKICWCRIEHAPAPDRLLAHVMAHEIGHMLQGTNRHSTTGIMKPVFTVEDTVQMRSHLFRFDPEDVKLILEALQKRTR